MCMGMTFAERMQMAVDEAHSAFVDGKSTIFCTQYQKKDWHARLRGGVHADAIMDRIVHNAVWLDSGRGEHEGEAEQRRTPETAPVATMMAATGNRSQFRW